MRVDGQFSIFNPDITGGAVVTNASPNSTDYGLAVRIIGGGASDGAIVDGVTSTIKATVFDFTNSNPLAVVLRDTNGDYVSVGGGTQYAEDAASAGAEQMTLAGTIRQDTPASSTSADGDYANMKTDSVGRLWVNASGAAVPVTDNSGSLTVDGTVAATQSGTWTVQPGNTANTTPWLASIHDGTTRATVRELGTNDALNVAICDASGVQITTFGGGTQYTEGDIDTTVTGTALMWEDTSDTLRVASASKPLPVGDAGGSLTVDNSTLSVVGGGVEATAMRVTIASDSTGLVSVDDNGGSITVDGSVTVSGTATVTGNKTEDSAAADGDSGLPILGVRNDAAASRTSADGDYGMVALDSAGRVGIADLGGTVSIDDGGGSITVDGSLSATFNAEKVEDAAHSTGATGDFILGVRNDAAASFTSADGDYSPVATDSAGRVGIADLGGTISIDDGGGSITVDGSLSATFNAEKVEDAAHSTGATGDFILGVRNDAAATLTSADGDYSPVATDSAGRIGIADLGGTITVDGTVAATQSGTWTVQPGNTPNTTPWLASIHDGTTKATVRELGTNDALNVAITDSSGNQISTFGGGTQYVEDVASAGGETMTLAGAIRQDTPASSTSADGDYTNLKTDSTGRLWTHVGSVDGTVTVSGTATVTGNKSEDAAAADGDSGLPILGVRNDSAASRTSLDGDYGMIALDSAGRVGVSDLGGTVSIDDGGGSITVDGSLSATFNAEKTEDAVHATGATGAYVLGVRNDAAATLTSADGDYSSFATDAAGRIGIADLGGSISIDDNSGSLTVDNSTLSVVGGGVESTALRVTIASDSTGLVSVDDNGGSLTVDGSVAATQSGTWSVDTELPAQASLADNTANPTTTSVGTFPHWFDGTTWDRAIGNSTDGLTVNLGSNNDVTVTSGTVSATQSGSWSVALSAGSATVGSVKITDGTTTASVRDLTTNDALNVAIVDGSGTQITSFGGGTQYVEDVASAGGETMTLAGAVRQDTPASSTSADGDYTYLKTDSAGRLWAAVQIQTHPELTASTPTFATVGTTSASAVVSNSSRKGLILVNTSNNNISLGFSGTTAVLNSGVTLTANGGTYVMTKDDFTTGQVNAIAAAASSNLSIQEYT